MAQDDEKDGYSRRQLIGGAVGLTAVVIGSRALAGEPEHPVPPPPPEPLRDPRLKYAKPPFKNQHQA